MKKVDQQNKPETGWQTPEQCNISELSLVDDLGGTSIQVGWDSIKGRSNMADSKLPEMLCNIFELMELSKEEALDAAKKYIRHEDGEPEEAYGIETFKISLHELSELLKRDDTDTRGALDKVRKHFLNQQDKGRDTSEKAIHDSRESIQKV